jgi:lipoic acid synthetase
VTERKPDWLKVRLRSGRNRTEVDAIVKDLRLHTVCEEANCPNRMECFSQRTATFLILGGFCTRSCRFCDVKTGIPQAPDPDEPARLAEAAVRLGLAHVVVTSVTRDDLTDGGADHFAATVDAIRTRMPWAAIELLIPDFQGNYAALTTVLEAGPEVLNHNVETVPRLYAEVRPQADYLRSLELLRRAATFFVEKQGRSLVKTGLMLGLGETEAELLTVFADLRVAGCDLLTLGQYLAPSGDHLPVAEWIRPERFDALKAMALEMGFRAVAAAPLVRSSYGAARLLD